MLQLIKALFNKHNKSDIDFFIGDQAFLPDEAVVNEKELIKRKITIKQPAPKKVK